jgi:hypothetical protein
MQLADDDVINLKLLRRFLETSYPGCHVDSVSDGQQVPMALDPARPCMSSFAWLCLQALRAVESAVVPYDVLFTVSSLSLRPVRVRVFLIRIGFWLRISQCL